MSLWICLPIRYSYKLFNFPREWEIDLQYLEKVWRLGSIRPVWSTKQLVTLTPPQTNHCELASRKAVHYFQAYALFPYMGTIVSLVQQYFRLSPFSEHHHTFSLCPFMKIPPPPHVVMKRNTPPIHAVWCEKYFGPGTIGLRKWGSPDSTPGKHRGLVGLWGCIFRCREGTVYDAQSVVCFMCRLVHFSLCVFLIYSVNRRPVRIAKPLLYFPDFMQFMF